MALVEHSFKRFVAIRARCENATFITLSSYFMCALKQFNDKSLLKVTFFGREGSSNLYWRL
jgi:hypothetical protein